MKDCRRILGAQEDAFRDLKDVWEWMKAKGLESDQFYEALKDLADSIDELREWLDEHEAIQ